MTDLAETLVGAHLDFSLSAGIRSMQKPANRIELLNAEEVTLSFIPPEPEWRGDQGKLGKTQANIALQGKFLEWIGGYVTVCPAGQSAVLSGPFSGCWFVRYFHAGQYHAAHIGSTESKNETTAAKRAFVEYVTKENIDMSQASCFNPKRSWPDDTCLEFMRNPDGTRRPIYILAYLTAAGDCHSLILARTKESERNLIIKRSPNFALPKRPSPESKPKFVPTQPSSFENRNNLQSMSTHYDVKGVRKMDSQKWSAIKDKEFPG
jgi:hypothetical protein